MRRMRAFLLLLVVFQSAGCASVKLCAPRAEKEPESPRSSQEPESLASWERKMEGMKGSDRVSIPVQVVRTWIRHEKQRDERYRELVGQLKALKNIDLEETGSPK